MWDDLICRLENAEQKVEIQHRRDTRSDDIGTEIVAEVDFVDFSMQGNDFRVEKIVTPTILDKKTHYSHTAGARTSVEYILSPDEKTEKIKAYRFDPDTDEYIELSGSGFLG